MEKPPSKLRGKLIEDIRAKNAEAAEGTKLRGTLAPRKESAEREGTKLRGTLAPKPFEPEVAKPKIEGVTLSKEFLPNVSAPPSLVGRTLIQRDGGLKAVFTEIAQRPYIAEDGTIVKYWPPVAKLHRSDNARISIGPEMLYSALTTEGGAWRLIEE